MLSETVLKLGVWVAPLEIVLFFIRRSDRLKFSSGKEIVI
jgi:hypothetical protein